MLGSALTLCLLLTLPALVIPWTISLPSVRDSSVRHAQLVQLGQLRAQTPVLQFSEDGDEDEGADGEYKGGLESDDFADENEALRYLAAEGDVERYLREGKSLLGQRMALILPSSDVALEDALLLASAKLIKLGASVSVVFDEFGAGRRPDVSKRVPFPRCTPIAANLTCADDVARALAGASTLFVGASMPTDRADALTAALQRLAERSSAMPSFGPSDAGVDAAADDVAAAAGAAEALEGSLCGVSQLVLLSSVEVYGSGLAETQTDRAADPSPSGDAEPSYPLRAEEVDPQPSEEAAAALLGRERSLAACCERVAVLRSCTLVGESGSDPLETLLSDALGLQDLLVEYLAELRAKTGLADAPTAAASAAAAATDAFAALMPHGSQLVQLTHVEELAGASVFAAIDDLDGTFHVASAPETLQRLFDHLAESREWPPLRLREAAREGESVLNPRFYCTRRLRTAGYELLWPGITPQPATDDSPFSSGRVVPSDACGDDAEATRVEPVGDQANDDEPDRGEQDG